MKPNVLWRLMWGSGALSPPTLILYVYTQRLQLEAESQAAFSFTAGKIKASSGLSLLTVSEFNSLFCFLSVVLLLF